MDNTYTIPLSDFISELEYNGVFDIKQARNGIREQLESIFNQCKNEKGEIDKVKAVNMMSIYGLLTGHIDGNNWRWD